MANSGMHLLVLYDTGTITGVGQINQEEVEPQGNPPWQWAHALTSDMAVLCCSFAKCFA